MPILVIGIITIFTVFQLETKGITSWITVGTLRLDDQQQYNYLQQVQDLSPENLAKKLKLLTKNKANVDQQGWLTVKYKGIFLDQQSVLRNYQSIKQVHLATLDQMVFTAPQSKSQKSRDAWSIRVFCVQKIACITKNTRRHLQKEKNITVRFDELIEVEGRANTRFALATLNHLIKAYGGPAELDQTKGVLHIYNKYKNN